MARRSRYLSIAQTERAYPSRSPELSARAQYAETLRDVFQPIRREGMVAVVAVRQHPRRGTKGVSYYTRRQSGHRRNRYYILKMLAARQGISEVELLDSLNSRDPYEIAHVRPDQFSGYETRSGGTNYARWMSYVRKHPENYRLLPKSENWKEHVAFLRGD